MNDTCSVMLMTSYAQSTFFRISFFLSKSPLRILLLNICSWAIGDYSNNIRDLMAMTANDTLIYSVILEVRWRQNVSHLSKQWSSCLIILLFSMTWLITPELYFKVRDKRTSPSGHCSTKKNENAKCTGQCSNPSIMLL